MLTRRRALEARAAAGALSVHHPLALSAQATSPTLVQYNEVVRSILYTPAYAAIARELFKEAGIAIALETAQGGDKSMAALITGRAGIGLMGPESAIYVKNSESPLK